MEKRDAELSQSLIDVNDAQDETYSPVTNGKPKFIVDRPVFSQHQFDVGFEAKSRYRPSVKKTIKKSASKCECSKGCVGQFMYDLFPMFGIMKKYKIKEYLSGDIISGLTVGIMHIPQGQWSIYPKISVPYTPRSVFHIL